MKNIEAAIDAAIKATGNVLIIGGECCGKSELTEKISERMLSDKMSIVAITNNRKIRNMINEDPGSKYIFKQKGDNVDVKGIRNTRQDAILIDECENIWDLPIDKKIILAITSENVDRTIKELDRYFEIIIRLNSEKIAEVIKG